MLQHSSTVTSPGRWWTVVAGGIGCALGAGVLVIYTFGVLASAMAAGFGWPRAVYANSLTLFLVFSGLGSLLLGPLIDRFGVRLPAATLAPKRATKVAAGSRTPKRSIKGPSRRLPRPEKTRKRVSELA